MAAVSAELLETIIEIQGLSSLKKALLDGGTNLAIRYNHRESNDIAESSVGDPLRLLLFVAKAAERKNRPNHSDHRILPQGDKKNWMTAQSSYRRKVLKLFSELGVDFPRLSHDSLD